MKYGDLPKSLGIMEVKCSEMMTYLYLPIKMVGEFYKPIYEERLKCFDAIVGKVCCDFIGDFGLDNYMASFIYLTAKHTYVPSGCHANRPGYHSDGFMTDDINYIWCDRLPTVFNQSEYALTMHHEFSLSEMEKQSLIDNEITFPETTLLRLNQFCIHKVSDHPYSGMRTFLKVSFSKDQYDLEGNSHNYLLKYNWEMKQRIEERNVPQTKTAQP